MLDHNGDEVTESTSPFWVKEKAIHFQSQNLADEGIFKWNSVGLTIVVTFEAADIDFPSEQVEFQAHET